MTATFHPFPNTHWSLVRRAGLPDQVAQREALKTLLERYLPALRSFLRTVMRMDEGEADDLLQAFVTEQVLVHRLISRADESRGRFRSLLLTSLRNFAVSNRRSQKVRIAESAFGSNVEDGRPTTDFMAQAEWARALVNGVIETMHRECAESGRLDVWTVFEERVLASVGGNRAPMAYESLSNRLGLPSPTSAANLLVTAKRMYERLLRAAVTEYVRDPARIDEEIMDLRRILAESCSYHNEPLESE
jgi:DNA-directed RNA polymerase specialized sigma24 family protein